MGRRLWVLVRLAIKYFLVVLGVGGYGGGGWLVKSGKVRLAIKYFLVSLIEGSDVILTG